MYFPRVLLKETIYGTDMAYSLMTKFNELTTGEFDYLVLESVDVEIGSESVRVNMIFPGFMSPWTIGGVCPWR